jgi:hypothetical protein
VDLAFSVGEAARVPLAAVPTLSLAVRIAAPPQADVRSILLDTQVQIAARRRAYDERSHERLAELFGPPEDWGRTLHTLPWTRVTSVVPPFRGTTTVDLPIICTYDLEVTATRYFDALAGGVVPLELLFSGTVFAADGPGGMLCIERLSWDHEAECRLPVAVWRETMDRHFGDAAWLRLGRERLDRVIAYRARHRLATTDDAIDALLAAADREEAGAWTTTT